MKVFYQPEQTAKTNDSFSPSAGKPADVVKRWKKMPGVEIVGFEPLTRNDLALAHDRSYVDGVLDLRRTNGFGNRSAEVAATLLYTTGSLYAAALHAFITKESCASPTSGFHHAGHSYGSGFCTFNGLMVAAAKLWNQFPRLDIGILDLDAHYGNGTDDIIEILDRHDNIVHYTFGGHTISKKESEAWLTSLDEILLPFRSCDLVLYQAGADPHVNDPLGGVLTTRQMYARDLKVFKALRKWGVPCAWNLAGGYQTPLSKVIDLHGNTALAFFEAFG